MNEAATTGRTGIRWGIVGPSLALAALVVLYTVYWVGVSGEVRKAVENFAARGEKGVVTSWNDLISGIQ